MRKVCVIGGANLDICGATIVPLRLKDSNPGEITFQFGGVGRNIAQMLRQLETPVEFVTCFSDDMFGKQLKENCAAYGMDISKSLVVKGKPTSTYLALLDDKKDMQIGMSDMRILDALTEEYIHQVVQELNEDDILVIDGNLSESKMKAALDGARCIVAADPVSANKAIHFKDVLNKLTVFKPNRYEAEYLSGIPIQDIDSAKENIQWFLQEGVKEVLISLAEDGVIYGTQQGIVWLRHRRIDVKNATGGGDAFMAGYLCKRLEHASPKEAVCFASSAAIATIELEQEQRHKITRQFVEEQITNNEIEEIEL